LPAARPTLSGVGQAPVASPPPEPPRSWLRDHKLFGAAALGGAVALALAALVSRSTPPPPAPAPPAPAPAVTAPPVAAHAEPDGDEPPRPAPVAAPDDVTLAREHLAAGRARQARILLEALLVKRPDDPEQLKLLGHAFHDEGDVPRALDAWARAQAFTPLDAAALERLAGDLGRDRPLADRAARLLVKAGGAAGHALAGQLASTSTMLRLRALAVAREIGPAGGVDVLGGYLSLLADPDCDVRRAAARGLGELKSRKALPRLREKAAEKNERRGLFGVLIESKPACGAPEAAEAVRRIEAR
jgi:serine/threonine-protein kinase